MPASERGQPGARGCVFNIQRYAVHDGPGIRTLVFMKGCPLRCRWCSNPESQHRAPQLAYNAAKCLGGQCLRCVAACRSTAIGVRGDGKAAIERARCAGCAACRDCVDACPSRALHVFGQMLTVDEVLAAVDEDSAFYPRSGGGLTVSGGEPLVQAAFVARLLREAKARHLGTALETCGYASWVRLEAVCRHLDTLIYDLKSADTARHREFTGVGNERIVANLRRVAQAFPDLRLEVKTPLIPGFNDDERSLAAIVELLRDHPRASHEILPYHRLGQPKYAFLDRPYALQEARLDAGRARDLARFARELRAAQLRQNA